MAKVNISYIVDMSNGLLNTVSTLDRPQIKEMESINDQIENISKLTTTLFSQKYNFNLKELEELEGIHLAIYKTLTKKAKKTKVKGIKKAQFKMREVHENVVEKRAALQAAERDPGHRAVGTSQGGVVKEDYQLGNLLKAAEGKKLVVVGEMHTDATHVKQFVTDLIESGKFSALYVEFSQATVNNLSSMANSSDPYVRKMTDLINLAKSKGLALYGLEREGYDKEYRDRKSAGEPVRAPEDAKDWAKKIGDTLPKDKPAIALVGDYHQEEFIGKDKTADGDLIVELKKEGVIKSTDELVRVGTVNGVTLSPKLSLYEADGLRALDVDTRVDFVYTYMPQGVQSTEIKNRVKSFEELIAEKSRKDAFRQALEKSSDEDLNRFAKQ